MKKLTVQVNSNLLQKEDAQLPRDFKKGEQVYVFAHNLQNLLGQHGLVCKTQARLPAFELPATHLTIQHKNKSYGIFMHAKGKNYQVLYCKALPIKRTTLIETIQANAPFIKPEMEAPIYKTENRILKIRSTKGQFHFEEAQLEDLGPLF